MFTRTTSLDFDIFDFSMAIGRNYALTYLTMNLLRNLPNQPIKTLNYDENKLVLFLNEIQRGYRSDVAYHNDLHGADVMQMAYIILTEGGLIELANLNHLYQVAMMVAGACHDYDHDGMNNTYHVNAFTSRTIRYHHKSVQENYHAA